MSFRDLELKGFYSAVDDRLNGFYVPLLKQARTYDRVSGYFSSLTLVAAAAGLSHFIVNGGTMRLIVGVRLHEDDIDAILHGEGLDEVLARRLTTDPLEATDIVGRHRLETIGYLVKHGRLQIRVGVPMEGGRLLSPRETDAYFHSKYGIFADREGNRVAFVGSDNETRQGWEEHHETFTVAKSWLQEVWSEIGRRAVEDFEAHWQDRAGSNWRIVPLPAAVEQRLIDRAPAEAPPPPDPAEGEQSIAVTDLALREVVEAPAKDGGTGVGFATSVIDPWPHQIAIARRVVDTFPRSYLFADEVGLGKTIEAGLVLRELMVSGRAKTGLLLVPASLLRQWQEELYEKFGLRVPRLTGSGFLDVYTDEELPSPGNPWSAYPLVLASSHLARRKDRREQVLSAGPWDVVLVDEAHHARRRGSKPTDTPNALLSLLMTMKARGAWKSLYLASATPMQMHPHEAWDLLQLLGLPGTWSESAAQFVRYFSELREPAAQRDWPWLGGMFKEYFSDPQSRKDGGLEEDARRLLGFAFYVFIERLPESGIDGATARLLDEKAPGLLERYFRANNPMRDRVFRTTRGLLHDYKRRGLLAASTTIPRRHVEDVFLPMTPSEKALYQRIEEYITRYYNFFMSGPGERKPLGFIMTIYRRRLTSSFQAIERSLQRRLDVLRRHAAASALLDEDDIAALESSDLIDLLPVRVSDEVREEIAELESFLGELREREPDETKAKRLHEDIEAAFTDKHDTVVLFTQYADTMRYLRDRLRPFYGSRIACYSGAGGERWDEATQCWTSVPKQVIKDLFREGRDVKILIGTDSMSEGLNLQTCGRLINYDMPWNFMRVEQRIGRVDRIGGRPDVEVTNYFYEDTVEQQIYEGIAEDVDWFEDVVGPAQPVIDQVEKAIERAAMRRRTAERAEEVRRSINEIKHHIEEAQCQPLTLESLEGAPEPEDAPQPAITLQRLAEILTGAASTRQRLLDHPEIEGAYLLDAPGGKVGVTLRRDVFERHPQNLRFLTYGTQELKDLLTGVPDIEELWAPGVDP